MVCDQAMGDPGFGGDRSALILTVFAEITVYGRTTSGKAVQDSARMQIDFADYPE